MLLVAITGRKKSGKTRLAESLANTLSGKWKVAFMKHIHHAGEPLDRVGSDTYRLTEAGAKAVIGVSPDAIFLRAKMNGEDFDLALKLLEVVCSDCELVLIEGFHTLLSKRDEVTRIYVAQDDDEASSVAKESPAPSFIYCESCKIEEASGIKILKSVKELADVIEEMLVG
ncbi:MAG TPA: hypothetical protein ENO36_03885 [Fervidicoccus fontis]|uniref:Molybdopterin-guanine dinucleotide biosynthesis protein B (MobB) domain-containing protein n=1 Tax=Fervidicoccus fontis TaxID=683846 RepID=A0A7C2YTK9_9CREN|nr:MAG: hypothetical protein C0179_03710 [Fervidicoccus sp.]HEU97978.1 hypothetical protein [Fervidicoccus fontis]